MRLKVVNLRSIRRRDQVGNPWYFGCRFMHDIRQYLTKLADIHMRELKEISATAPFVASTSPEAIGYLKYHLIRIGVKFPIFEDTGECRYNKF
jgi:hypothetical protein